MAHNRPRHILITGASSGLGEALALAYAAPGIMLSVTGRDRARVDAVTAACRGNGADATGAVLDVTDADAMAAWILARDAAWPLDLVIANAGVSANTVEDATIDEAAKTRRLFAINVDGTVNTVMPAIALMKPRRHGQIALMSSLAAFRNVGGAPAYGASKAAVRLWGEGLRQTLAPHNVRVSVICPGFVRSRITDHNRFRMPFFIDNPAAAAAIMVRGLAQNRGRISYPWPMAALAVLYAALPNSLAEFFMGWFPER
jgi:NADP-dependent 3-hydroxy acid dehydrogenase YdfG